jgi:F-type H+-transporting ATPase subunit gamma
MYYNKFKNAMTQVMTRTQVLPVSVTMVDTKESAVSEYEYEGENLVNEVINLYMDGQINYALLQNKASEEGARMTAMDNATRNAGELIEKLTLKLNRSRQSIITTELTEIISGAEAV